MLDSTPSLLSLGKRCLELGYRFVWEPFCKPEFFDPDKRKIPIEVINIIPYLTPVETEVVAGRSDLPRVYPALPAPIILHENVVAAGEAPLEDDDSWLEELEKEGERKRSEPIVPTDGNKGHTINRSLVPPILTMSPVLGISRLRHSHSSI